MQCVNDPTRILVKKEEPTLEGIRQFDATVECDLSRGSFSREKKTIAMLLEWELDTLRDLLTSVTTRQAVILCNTSRNVDWFTQKVCARVFTASPLMNLSSL